HVSHIAPDRTAEWLEPFFTPKTLGHGTGLGLSMVYGFVKQSQGHIKVYSEYGHGTTVKLYMPRSVATVAAAPRDDVADRMERGSEAVLVVEDDPLVRSYVMTQVQSLGYRALAADGAEQALRIIRSDAVVDLLFTDVIMPGTMNVPRLVGEALKLRPKLRVLYTSGYTENAVVHH